jgi:hypothetical protein
MLRLGIARGKSLLRVFPAEDYFFLSSVFFSSVFVVLGFVSVPDFFSSVFFSSVFISRPGPLFSSLFDSPLPVFLCSILVSLFFGPDVLVAGGQPVIVPSRPPIIKRASSFFMVNSPFLCIIRKRKGSRRSPQWQALHRVGCADREIIPKKFSPPPANETNRVSSGFPTSPARPRRAPRPVAGAPGR